MADIERIEIKEHGGAEQLHLVERPLPEPGPGQVRVRHTAIGVNFIDIYHRTGLYPVPALPSGLGLEAAGTIESCGEGVHGFSTGDRVVYCSGPLGAYATAHVVEAGRLVRIPDTVEDADAAAVLLKGLTVQYLIRQIHPCRKGETVLFHAAAGGVGLIAMQWLRALGVTVIGTVSSEAKATLAREHGCTHVIRLQDEDVVARVRELTDGAGVPVVYDSVGAATFERSLDCLARRGLMVSFGNASGPVPPFDLGMLAAKGSLMITRPTLAHFTDSREKLEVAAAELFAHIASGAIRITRNASLPLKDARAAHEQLEARKTTGSTILIP